MKKKCKETLTRCRRAAMNAVLTLVQDCRGDAGTNWLIGVLITVVVVGLLLSLLVPSLQGWWTELVAKVTDMLSIS